jgi:branched-chain amino acid aminotransferase
VAEIDDLPVGAGKRGPMTRKLQEAFFDVVQGKTADKHGWLTYVRKKASKKLEVPA